MIKWCHLHKDKKALPYPTVGFQCSSFIIESIEIGFVVGAEKETSQLPQEPTQDKGSLDQSPGDITGSTITWRLLRKNSIKPEEKTIHEFLEEYQKEPRPGILNPKFTSPTSLPLYFYFGYQLLQESDLLQKCGHVRWFILIGYSFHISKNKRLYNLMGCNSNFSCK